jgi:hypothetical protein
MRQVFWEMVRTDGRCEPLSGWRWLPVVWVNVGYFQMEKMEHGDVAATT